MSITDPQPSQYLQHQVACFRRSKEQHGDLSNMTHGFPLEVNATAFQSSEALYQALKYPRNPGAQAAIGKARSGMDAKRVAYALPDSIEPGWDSIRVHAMMYTLAVKLAQNPGAFGKALLNTRGKQIVEFSTRDAFWGAKPNGNLLVGANALGKALTGLRDQLVENKGDVNRTIAAFLDHIPLDRLAVNGQPVTIPLRRA